MAAIIIVCRQFYGAGLRKFRAIGKSNAEAMWYFACTIYNIQKIWKVKEGNRLLCLKSLLVSAPGRTAGALYPGAVCSKS